MKFTALLHHLTVDLLRESFYSLKRKADLKNFFGSLSHEWMLRFVEHRVGDQRLISLIRRWLKAGVLENGEVQPSEEETRKEVRSAYC